MRVGIISMLGAGPDRRCCGHHRGGRQPGWTPRGFGNGSRHCRGRTDLDRVLGQADPAGSARRQTGHLVRRANSPPDCVLLLLTARGHQGCRHKGALFGGATIPRIVALSASTWQRCRVHFMRNVLAHARKSGRRVVSAFSATAFAQGEADQRLIRGINRPPNAETASTQWRAVADQIRPKVPKLATIMYRAMGAPPVRETTARAEPDVLA